MSKLVSFAVAAALYAAFWLSGYGIWMGTAELRIGSELVALECSYFTGAEFLVLQYPYEATGIAGRPACPWTFHDAR